MRTNSTKIEIRLSLKEMELFKQAAEVLGVPVEEFACSGLVRFAKETIEQLGVTRLTDRDRDIFVAMLDADDEPSPALAAAFREVG